MPGPRLAPRLAFGRGRERDPGTSDIRAHQPAGGSDSRTPYRGGCPSDPAPPMGRGCVSDPCPTLSVRPCSCRLPLPNRGLSGAARDAHVAVAVPLEELVDTVSAAAGRVREVVDRRLSECR